ncbi:hypothetical protein OG528_35895 [Streptomyces platensis]
MAASRRRRLAAYAADIGRRLGQVDFTGSPITSCTTAKEGFDEG